MVKRTKGQTTIYKAYYILIIYNYVCWCRRRFAYQMMCLGHPSSPSVLVGFLYSFLYSFVNHYLSFCLFSWPLYCLFFDLRLLITPLISTNFSYIILPGESFNAVSRALWRYYDNTVAEKVSWTHVILVQEKRGERKCRVIQCASCMH